MTQKLLITGCAGFIGTTLIKTLNTPNYEIDGIDSLLNSPYPAKRKLERLQELQQQKNFHQFSSNYHHIHRFLQNKKYDCIIHLGAITQSSNLPNVYTQYNIQATQELLHAITFHQWWKPLIFISGNIYPSNQTTLPYTEDFALNINTPTIPYTQSKIQCEKLIQKQNQKHHTPYTILRLFTNYGPDINPNTLLFKLLNAANKHQIITLHQNPNTTYDYTYIDDIIQGIQQTIQHPYGNTIYNLGSDQKLSLQDLINHIEQITATQLQIKWATSLNPKSYQTYINSKKAKKYLQWKPKIKIVQGLRLTQQWFKYGQ